MNFYTKNLLLLFMVFCTAPVWGKMKEPSLSMAEDGLESIKEENPKIKLYTFFTPSHEELKNDYFLPSLQDVGLEIIVQECPQECPSALVFSEGWQKSMLRKVDMIIQAIYDNWGSIFIYADIDTQYFGPISDIIRKEISNKDMVIQRDTPSGTMCAGFLACRANSRTLKLWQAVRNYMINSHSPSDQKTLNKLLRHNKNNEFNMRWDYLPSEQFCGGGTFSASPWRPGKSLHIPLTLLMHHANWTTGTVNKIEQLKYVREIIKKGIKKESGKSSSKRR